MWWVWDGDGGETSLPESDKHPTRSEIPPIVLRLTHLAHAHRAQAQIAPTREAKNDSEDDEHDRRVPGWQPERETRHDAHGDAEDERVHTPNHISDQARKEASEKRARVQDREDLEAKGRAVAVRDGVRCDVCERDEDAPLHEEDAQRDKGKRQVPEHAQIRRDGLPAADALAGQAAAHE